METEELKCCPFCWSKNISSAEVMGKNAEGNFFQQTACLDCGANGPQVLFANSGYLVNAERTDEKWNFRPKEQRLDEEIEQLQAENKELKQLITELVSEVVGFGDPNSCRELLERAEKSQREV